MLCWFLLLVFHMTQIWWRSCFRMRGNNFSPESFVTFRLWLKARLLFTQTWYRNPRLKLWACERDLHLCFCYAVLNLSWRKRGKNFKLSAEIQVLCNIWFCGRLSLTDNPDFKTDFCFWQEVQKLHSSVSRLL